MRPSPSRTVLEQIDVGAWDEVTWLDAELRHQRFGDGDAFGFRLVGLEDDFQFEKRAEAIDLIEVDARGAHHEESARFLSRAPLATNPVPGWACARRST